MDMYKCRSHDMRIPRLKWGILRQDGTFTGYLLVFDKVSIWVRWVRLVKLKSNNHLQSCFLIKYNICIRMKDRYWLVYVLFELMHYFFFFFFYPVIDKDSRSSIWSSILFCRYANGFNQTEISNLSKKKKIKSLLMSHFRLGCLNCCGIENCTLQTEHCFVNHM